MTRAEMDAAICKALGVNVPGSEYMPQRRAIFIAGMRAAADGIADGALPYSIFGEAARKIRAAADELEREKA